MNKKSFLITVTTDGDKFDLEKKNTGFSVLELLGVLDLMSRDIREQMSTALIPVTEKEHCGN